jgi:hypothetical protein
LCLPPATDQLADLPQLDTALVGRRWLRLQQNIDAVRRDVAQNIPIVEEVAPHKLPFPFLVHQPANVSKVI